MARPKGTTKLELNPELQNRIITYIKAGSYIETAEAAAGICKDTLYDWLRRGANGEEPFGGFSDAVQRALAEAEIRDLARIDKAAEMQWQAAAWKLERRNPRMWGRREYQELTGADGGPIETRELQSKTTEELIAEWQELKALEEADVVEGES